MPPPPSRHQRFGLFQIDTDQLADALFHHRHPEQPVHPRHGDGVAGGDLALFRQGLSPFGRQMAVMPCPCLRRSDGWNPNLDGWTALDHLSGVGCPTPSVAAFRCECG